MNLILLSVDMSALLDPRREERSLQVADMTDNVVLIHNSISCTHGMRMFKTKYEVSSKLFGFWTLHSELHNTSGTNKKRGGSKKMKQCGRSLLHLIFTGCISL